MHNFYSVTPIFYRMNIMYEYHSTETNFLNKFLPEIFRKLFLIFFVEFTYNVFIIIILLLLKNTYIILIMKNHIGTDLRR